MASEKNFENRLKKWLTERGAWHVKYFANRNTRSGIPDILACVNGRFLAIEVKGEGGRPSPLQLHHVEQIRKSGGLAVIAWPDDFERLKALVMALERGEDGKDLLF